MVLQYVNMMLRGVAAIHLPFSVVCLCRSSIPADVLPIDSAYSGKFKYLTLWIACIDAAYFCFALVENLFSNNEKKPLRKVRDFWFMSIVLPLSCFVSFTFWTLMIVNRDLVMPEAFDKYLPPWLNHSLHTFISIYAFLELLTTNHQMLTTVRKHCYGLWSVAVPYLIWCNVVYFKSGLWVYPILGKLNWPCRILFFAGCLAGATAFCYGGCYVNSLIWEKKSRSIGGKKKKK